MSMNVPQVSPLDGTVGGVGASLLEEKTALGVGLGSLGPHPTSRSLFLLPACGQRWDCCFLPPHLSHHNGLSPSGIISQTKLSPPQVVYAHGASLSSRKKTNALPTIQNPLASSNAFYFSFPVG